MSDMWGKSRISEFMRKLLTAYSKYFNLKYNRSGGLFEGPFKSILVSEDVQAKYLFSYIHLNPIKLIDSKWKKNGIKNKKTVLDFLATYKWSSYLDHKRNHRKESIIIQLPDFPEYFQDVDDFDQEILDWINFPPNSPHV
ncbi:MAG: hypothetical protein US18_C0021G0003 [Parcubacteria group bacterium GW2011_GWB1_36_5]|nr:MAG: hypothetical protein US12_C0008G0003 [Parcubacteria group bacterium GW2011_GWA2_36_24]KKQ07271.1 MAG: hypothetical protein US18_C0021G0003 [Parcubacteria group bacterium GW2011_GWB1_36_5]